MYFTALSLFREVLDVWQLVKPEEQLNISENQTNLKPV